MIYHNYSPYYYGRTSNQNRKIANSNKYPTTPYGNNSYYNTQHVNNQKNFKKNYYNPTFFLLQPHEEPEERTSNQKKIPPKSNNDVIFEIFGIKLYFDDILLICLIFFLYNEGVKDQYLFIALILLLLS